MTEAKSNQEALDATGADEKQLVVFSMDHEEYALPIIDTQEVIHMTDITPVPNSPDFIAGIINLRGRIISIINLEKRFGLKRDGTETAAQHIIVSDVDDVPLGIIVDGVTEIVKVPADAIQDAPSTVQKKIGSEHIMGVVVIKKQASAQAERVLLLLNVRNIMSKEEKHNLKSVTSTSPPTKKASTPKTKKPSKKRVQTHS